AGIGLGIYAAARQLHRKVRCATSAHAVPADSVIALRHSPAARMLVALVAGLAAGTAVAVWPHPMARTVIATIEPVGTIWVNGIRMTVIPLVVALLVTGIAAAMDVRAVGRLGGRALLLFVAALSGAALLSGLIAPPLMAGLAVDPAAVASLRASAAASAGGTVQVVRTMPTFGEWLVTTIPTNPVRAAADGAMLPLVVFAVALGIAITRISAERREAVIGLFRAVGDAMLVIVGWLIVVAPAGVFALSAALAMRMGLGAAGALAYYVALMAGLCTAIAVALYPVATVLGRVPLVWFARATLPAQAVALSSRSSLAALPALIDGARTRLALPQAVVGFVLPLAVSVLRLNTPVTWAVGLPFLARLYGVELEPAQIVPLMVTSVLVSFSVPGIPSAGLFLLAPGLAAVGIPVEGVGILIAVDAIPDMFKTMLNVTGHMTAATVLARSEPAVVGQSAVES
ncbi:MAG: dicarboxylate/amino acid:cation symporter, partial [Gemmatimonadota bacterium]|nr:dicarboxylate/amino acid:cation symporter [Gemmatimonadota bacterium]